MFNEFRLAPSYGTATTSGVTLLSARVWTSTDHSKNVGLHAFLLLSLVFGISAFFVGKNFKKCFFFENFIAFDLQLKFKKFTEVSPFSPAYYVCLFGNFFVVFQSIFSVKCY